MSSFQGKNKLKYSPGEITTFGRGKWNISRDNKLFTIVAYMTITILFSFLLNQTKTCGNPFVTQDKQIISESFVPQDKQSRTIDSLKNLLKELPPFGEIEGGDTTRITTLNHLAWELRTSDTDTAIYYSTQALALAEKTVASSDESASWRRKAGKTGIANSYHNLGWFNYLKGNDQLALDYYDKALEIWEELGKSTKHKSEILNKKATTIGNIGIIFEKLGDYPATSKYFFERLKIKKELLKRFKRGGDTDKIWRVNQEIADSYDNIGLVYENHAYYTDAQEYYFISLSLKKELLGQAESSQGGKDPGDSSAVKQKIREVKQGMAYSCNNIGINFLRQGDLFREKGDTVQAFRDYTAAQNVFFESLKINEEIKDKNGIAHSYNNIGLLYSDMGDLSREKGNTAQASRNYSAALENYFESLKINKESGEKADIAGTYINIGLAYTKYGKYGDAVKYLKKGLEIAREAGFKQGIKAAYIGLIDVNGTLENYKKECEYLKLYSAINDTLFNEEKSNDLNSMEAKHKFEFEKMKRKAKVVAKVIAEAKRGERINYLQHSSSLIIIMLFFIAVFILTNLYIPVRLAEGIIFFTFLIFFNLILVLTAPYVETFTGGESGYKLAINASVAGIIIPLYQVFERRLKNRILKTKNKFN
ncbi:MAG: tetratricopeptide repeat protein [Bacteroidota bacterium]